MAQICGLLMSKYITCFQFVFNQYLYCNYKIFYIIIIHIVIRWSKNCEESLFDRRNESSKGSADSKKEIK